MIFSKTIPAIFAATLGVALFSSVLQAADAPTAKELIAVLQSDATTFDKAEACRKLAALGDKAAVPALAAFLADEKLASHARCSLETIADRSAAAALREALGKTKGNLRIGVVNSLGVRRDALAVDALQKLAADRASGAADESLMALGRIATPAAVETLKKALLTVAADNPAALADACLACADQLLVQGKQADAIALLDQLRMAELPVHLRAAATFRGILARQSGDLSLLISQLKAEDPALFAAAIRATRFLTAPEVTKTLVAEMAKLPPARQALLIGVLSERNDPAAQAAIEKAAAAGPTEVRLTALAALAQFGGDSITRLLLDTALAEDAAMAQAARISLLRSRAKGIGEALAARLDQAGAKDRLVLLDLVGQRGAVSAAATVVRLAKDPSDEVRLAALRAMGRLVGPEHFAELVACLQNAKTPDEAAIVQESLRAACGRVADPDAGVQRLRDCMADRPIALQTLLLERIGQIGGAEALKVVGQNAREANPELQDAATKVLGNWMSVDAAPVLLELAKTLTDAKFKTRCLRGYLRIARQLDMPTERRLAMCDEAIQAAARDDEKRLAAEVIRVVTSKGATKEQLAQANAILAKLPRKKGPLFDGRTFTGWEGDTKKTFRIQDGAIVGGNLNEPIPRNEFLCTKAQYSNFIFRAECKLVGPGNAGIQIRSQRIPNHHEVSGFQADISAGPNGGYWGCLYDESRRNKMLAKPDRDTIVKALKPDDWNLYEIRCEGPRIRLSINGVQTVDYTETDTKIPATGIIGLQIHGGKPSEAWYRNITIEELP